MFRCFDVDMPEWLLSKNLAGEIEFKNLIKDKPIPYMRGAFAAPIHLTDRNQRRFLKPNISGWKPREDTGMKWSTLSEQRTLIKSAV